MGHTEMLLAVAGVNDEAVKPLTDKLAAGDWSGFSPGERQAFLFARKLSTEPYTISKDDLIALQRHFGPDRTADIVWWASRCHYMTRVADAFQLPLERENVFKR
jgi:hypothetical protein